MSRPYTVAELEESDALLRLLESMITAGCDDDEIETALLLHAAEPLQRSMKQEIGPETLSLARLQREAAARGCSTDEASVTVFATYGFRLDWLPSVVAALDPPDEFTTDGGHKFTGEEGVLLLLMRFRSADALSTMTWETGRSIAAISEAVWYMVCCSLLVSCPACCAHASCIDSSVHATG